MKTILISLIRAYQFLLSPWLGNQCRFYPTCSAYAIEAIQRHGGLKGGWLAIKRLGRCQPWCEGGFDPVPGTESCSENCSAKNATHDSPSSNAPNVKEKVTRSTKHNINEQKP
ncbi:MAG: membrane protein insertion efficiency factor YidD [Gammaproteobacteria bacterium]|nr:membrane protein insertion efficiency factor YidD [Gammaproteobacteria bacterium]MBQ0775098.1 membrane protein insertion efficiency factor YidD [Gammaproteobacteria bacterium]